MRKEDLKLSKWVDTDKVAKIYCAIFSKPQKLTKNEFKNQIKGRLDNSFISLHFTDKNVQ